jgi:N utilization substance protein B
VSRGEIAARSHARELALQAVYQWLLHAADAERPAPASLVELPAREQLWALKELATTPDDDENATKKRKRAHLTVDADFFTALLQGTVGEAAELRALFAPLITRAVEELSPVEHAVLLLGAFELRHGVETPYRVVINEAIELAKKYGGTDGHKFVNGVLDRLAASLRPQEVATARAKK